MKTSEPSENRLAFKARVLQNVLPRIRPAFLAAWVKRALRVQRVNYSTHDGTFTLDPITFLGYALTRGKSYEPDMVRTIKQCLQPGNVFVDLGANEGYFTVLGANRVGRRGRVIAIEPQPRLQAVIRKNVALNQLEDSITIREVAVGDRIGTADFHLASELNTGSSGFVRMTRYGLPTVTVPTITLAALLDETGIARVDLLKVDIEGAEYEAILGSRELFREHRVKTIALELHVAAMEKRGHDPNEIARFLEECGYKVDHEFNNLVYRVPS